MKQLYLVLVAVASSFCVKAQSIYFPPLTGSEWDTISPQSLNYCQPRIDSLYAFLDSNNTKAFLLLKDGKIILEKYFGTHTQSSLWQWASAGKTITSFMVGIAQQENYLSISDPTSDYLGQGWTHCTSPQEAQITIRNQLTMTSGLDDAVPNNSCTLDSCLIYKADAGTRWAYHNAPYTLLDSVIESATGSTLNQYVTQKLKTPTGMTGFFLPLDYNNVYFSTARSMARFGLLILNKGNWNGAQLMTDTTYFSQMINTSQALNLSYGYLWWLNGKSSYMIPQSQFVFNGFLSPRAPADMFAAMGKDGQFLNIVPSQNLVLVRMGEAPDALPVPFLLNDEIWRYVNDLECVTIGVEKEKADYNRILLIPQPAHDMLTIQSDELVVQVEIYNVQGQLVKTQHLQRNELSISISELSRGLFIVKASMSNGRSWTGKLIKE